MKPIFLWWMTASLALHAQELRIQDAATHERLTAIARKAQLESPMQKLASAQGSDPSNANPIPDLISQSDILCYNGLATLVPKRAIFNLPKSIVSRVNNFQQGSTIMGWKDFYQNNRGWISTIEVTREQAEGKVPLDEKVVELYRENSNLVVATYKGGPISMMPARKPEEPAAITATDTTSAKPKP